MEATQDQVGRKFVVFRLGDEEYGLPIERVQSIIRYERSTPVPRAPTYVQGVINLRGKVIPVVDLSRRLGGAVFEPTPHSRIVVTEGDAGLVGLCVDSASEVAALEDIKPPPDSALLPECARAIEGVAEHEGRLVVLLDIEQVVPTSDYALPAGSVAASVVSENAEESEGNA